MAEGTVLFVKKNVFDYERITEDLKQEGYTIIEAFSCEEALNAWDREPPDVVIINEQIRDEGLDSIASEKGEGRDPWGGISVFYTLRSKRREPDYFLIGQYLEYDPSRIAQLRMDGIRGYLNPHRFNSDEIIEDIESALKRKE